MADSSNLSDLFDLRALSLTARQAGGLVRALGGASLAAALQRPATHQRRGRAVVAGLTGEVEILRDQWGVPHCFAESAGDALFALGYVQAQDRLWQMQWSRRAALGRLAEIAGPQALPVDRLCRTLGIGRVSEQAWAETSAAQQAQLRPYIAGINAAIARAPKPFEAQLLGDWVGPWQPAHSIAWGKLLSLLLAPAWEQQLIRAQIVEQAGLAALAAIDPPISPEAAAAVPPEAPYGELNPPAQAAARTAVNLLGLQTGASNNWAVDGRHTADGAPLFACDPHLNPVAPAHTYFVHLHCPEFNAAGASVPGLPGIVWGLNDHLAWGPTAALMAMNAAVVEQISADGSQSLTPSGWTDVAEREEVIKVAGYPAETLPVRETVHGPIVSEQLAGGLRARRRGSGRGSGRGSARAVSLHSRILVPQHGGGGIADLLAASNWAEFSAAVGDMLDFNLCFAYADRTQVGLRVSGAVPAGNMARLRFPAAGWRLAADRGAPTGAVSGDDLPHIVNPQGGFVVSANAPLAPAAASRFGAEYLDPARTARIRDQLSQLAPHTIETFQQIQTDRVSVPLREFAQELAQLVEGEVTAAVPAASLREWNGEMGAGSVAAAVVAAALVEYRRDELQRILGEEWRALLAPLLAIPTLDIFAAHATTWALGRIRADRAAAAPHLSAAYSRALRVLRKRLGPDAAAWTWGRCRPLVLKHGLADAPVVGGLLSPGPFPFGGEADTVAQAGVIGLRHVAEATAIPALRLIVRLSDPPEAVFALAGEQVHEALRPTGPLTDAYLQDRYRPLLRDREAIEAAAKATPGRRAERLRLRPLGSVD